MLLLSSYLGKVHTLQDVMETRIQPERGVRKFRPSSAGLNSQCELLTRTGALITVNKICDEVDVSYSEGKQLLKDFADQNSKLPNLNVFYHTVDIKVGIQKLYFTDSWRVLSKLASEGIV